MEAKDTVMSDEKMMELERMLSRAEGDHKICEAQAEISFKVGYDKALAQLADMTEECKRIGRREVVDWTAREFGVDWSEEQEQLKEWGIEL